LNPLAVLVAGTDDPPGTCARLRAATERSDVKALVAAVGSKTRAEPALRYAGIVDDEGILLPEAHEQLIRLEAVVATRTVDADRWDQVVTVPPYLRGAVPQGEVHETLHVLTDLISRAKKRVVMASPFLDVGFDGLSSEIVRLVRRGGTFLLLTRDLQNPGSHNSKVVNRLRDRCENSSDLEVIHWEEAGLGLHMKALVVDSRRAYVGSANFTRGGFGYHAELGVLLEGPSVM
jgi:phosphatidylserine/phosphatidylglycerophosphate/cardiolipin synthase-like enzyme